MKPYGYPNNNGISGRRQSKDTPHRRRCLRIDKKRSRLEVRKMIMEDAMSMPNAGQ